MKFSDGIPVSHATLHVASPVKYAGTEQTLCEQKIKGVQMALFPQGLVLKVKHPTQSEYGYTLFPTAGVKTMQIDMQDDAPVKITRK